MKPVELASIRIRLQMAAWYLADLEALQGGDVNRFGRMVDGRGRQLGNVDQWREYVSQVLTDEDVVGAYPERVETLRERAMKAGVAFEEEGGDHVEG